MNMQIEEASIEMIAEELGREWRQSELDKENSIEGKVRCALLMLKLKEACGTNNNKFSLELIDHDINASKDERAAMLKFARLSERDRNLVASDMKRRGVTSFLQEGRAGVFDFVEDPLPESETVESPVVEPVCDENDLAEEVKSLPEKSKPAKTFANRERAEEVAHVVSKWKNRSQAIGDIHPKFGWPFLLETMDMGLLSVEGSEASSANGRCLFNLPTTRASSEYLGRYDLSTPKGCKIIAEDLMPFLRRNAEVLKEDPMQFMPLQQAELAARREAIKAQEDAERKAKQLAEISARGEKEVVVAGIQLWPHKHQGVKTYNYEQLRQAWFIFLDAEAIAEAPSNVKRGRKSRSICHRHMANKIERTGVNMNDSDKEHLSFVMSAYREIVYAMEIGPDDNLLTAIPWNDIRAV